MIMLRGSPSSDSSSQHTLLTPYRSGAGTPEEEEELALLQRLEQMQQQSGGGAMWKRPAQAGGGGALPHWTEAGQAGHRGQDPTYGRQPGHDDEDEDEVETADGGGAGLSANAAKIRAKRPLNPREQAYYDQAWRVVAEADKTGLPVKGGPLHDAQGASTRQEAGAAPAQMDQDPEGQRNLGDQIHPSPEDGLPIHERPHGDVVSHAARPPAEESEQQRLHSSRPLPENSASMRRCCARNWRNWGRCPGLTAAFLRTW